MNQYVESTTWIKWMCVPQYERAYSVIIPQIIITTCAVPLSSAGCFSIFHLIRCFTETFLALRPSNCVVLVQCQNWHFACWYISFSFNGSVRTLLLTLASRHWKTSNVQQEEIVICWYKLTYTVTFTVEQWELVMDDNII